MRSRKRERRKRRWRWSLVSLLIPSFNARGESSKSLSPDFTPAGVDRDGESKRIHYYSLRPLINVAIEVTTAQRGSSS